MYIHIGNSKIVFSSDLIGIFNFNPISIKNNELLLAKATDDALYKKFGNDHPKSFVVTNNMVHRSPISPATLSKRNNSFV